MHSINDFSNQPIVLKLFSQYRNTGFKPVSMINLKNGETLL